MVSINKRYPTTVKKILYIVLQIIEAIYHLTFIKYLNPMIR